MAAQPQCPFSIGQTYVRSSLHREWNGDTRVQQQGGILTPKAFPGVLAITGTAGAQYGYDDHWDDDGVFHYYGAGQTGDMVFKRGNRALRDHAKDGKPIYLFSAAGPSLTFEGTFTCVGHYTEDDVPDATGAPRVAIVFALVPSDDGQGEPPVDTDASLDSTLTAIELAKLAAGYVTKEPTTARERRTLVRLRSQALRRIVRLRAGGICEGCGNPAPFVDKSGEPYLEPHHTTRVADGGPDSPDNVIALCPSCHRRVHSGRDGDAYNEQLREALAVISGP